MRTLVATTGLLLMMPVGSIAFAQTNYDGLSCEDPETQNEMNLCAFREFEAADKELNDVWKTTMSWVKRHEADLPSHFHGGPEKLLTAQRLWIEFRDAHCESDAHSSIGGTIHPLLYHSCRAGLTRERTKQLRAIALEG